MEKLGILLKKARLQEGLSIKDVSDKAKIREEHIINIENDKYGDLHMSEIYIKGYIRSYAKLLNLSESLVMAIYRRERLKIDNIQGQKTKFSNLNRPRFIVTPKKILIISSILIFSVFMGVIGRQTYLILSSPSLELTSPSPIELGRKMGDQNQTMKFEANTTSIVLEGKSDRGSIVWLNDKRLETEEDGSFSSQLSLQKGDNVYHIKANNGFEKDTRVELQIIYK